MEDRAAQETPYIEIVVFAVVNKKAVRLCKYYVANGVIPRVGDRLSLNYLKHAITSYKDDLPSSGTVKEVIITPQDVYERPYLGFVASGTFVQVLIQTKA